MTTSQSSGEIDDSLYSRQRCVIGENAMQLLSKARVFICGLSGVGVEIAKDIILAGVGEVIIQDGSVCSYDDLGTQFYIRESDILNKKTRAEASLPRLAALNPYVKVTLDRNDLTQIRTPLSDPANTTLFQPLLNQDTKSINCLVMTHGTLNSVTLLDVFCRKYNIPFVYTETYGVMGHLFCDFGPNFMVKDPNGEPPKEFFIGEIEKSPSQLLVRTFGERRHQLETGDVIRFDELVGMTQLNGRTYPVKVVSPTELVVETDTEDLSSYHSGGIARQVIQTKTVSFDNLLDQLRCPTIVISDLSCPDNGLILHRVFLTLKTFQNEMNRYPEPWNETDWELFREKFETVSSLSPQKVSDVDMDFVRRLALTSSGQILPLCAFFGSVAAQEVMKAITGAFTPFNQWLYMHADSVIPRTPSGTKEMQRLRNSRYAPLRVCIGPENVRRLRQLSVFMVGAGAIGCELLKNLALLGVATNGHLEETGPQMRSCELMGDLPSPTESGQQLKANLGYDVPDLTSQNRVGSPDQQDATGRGLTTLISSPPAVHCTRSCDQQTLSAFEHSSAQTLHGRILVTDPDHIEKSNLNRQFLFHSEHIGQSKSLVAACATREINPAVTVESMIEKFCPSTAKTVFTDPFLQNVLTLPANDGHTEPTGVVLAALDCVASRRYTDTRCVSLRVPLFESGTLGAKGHVQVVLPGLTESYNSQHDDDSGSGGSQSIPYCTLKSFPSLPVHCIEWAREKFASSFTLKPTKLNQLLSELGEQKLVSQNLVELLAHLREQQVTASSDKVRQKATWLASQLTRSLVRFVDSRPVDWVGCVQLARDKFERYFNHKARQLLHSFPPDCKLPDGSLFWKLPRRQPKPVIFDSANPLHQQFVLSYARIVALQSGISLPDSLGVDPPSLETHLEACFIDYTPPRFTPSTKRIVTDENEKADDQSASNKELNGSTLDEHLSHSLHLLEQAIQNPRKRKLLYAYKSVSFEKDDDQLPHVDFVAAAANLRATMYGLSVTPRHEVRRIAGRIVPAIATTTAAVAGLVCLELLKYVCCFASDQLLSDARNAFLNLALPVIVLSEPGPCPRQKLPNGKEFTLWDRTVLPAPADFHTYRLKDFMEDLKGYHGLEACVINQGNRMVYVNYLPLHASRLVKPLKSLITIEPDDRYVDLLVAYDAGPNTDYVQGPPVRLMLMA